MQLRIVDASLLVKMLDIKGIVIVGAETITGNYLILSHPLSNFKIQRYQN